ncbi:ammonium transporter [Streptococcus penaeicida]|uniref:ammonium transporter n=1 Tax=Streptococcus penaeicida TaxID=1765960 RepID=UPI0039F0E778
MFLFICILMMWLMIFGVGMTYYANLSGKLSGKIIFQFVILILMASLAWLLWGYGLSFRTSIWSVLFAGNIKLKDSLETFFQLCFFLYAIVMLVGSVMDRLRTGQLILLGVLWMTFVYCPLAYLIWNPEGFLAQLGVLDFSGGIVVHLSAGFSSLVLALLLGPSPHLHNDPVEVKWHYLGMLFITLGWFGFNAGPVGELNQQAGLVLINSLIAIIAGGISWSVAEFLIEKKESAPAVLNGMVVGLVTSTAGVGYLAPWQMLLIVSISSTIAFLAMWQLRLRNLVDDVVDSFAMNGVGGFCGSLGILLFYPSHLIAQSISILLTILLSLFMTWLIAKVCRLGKI